MIRRPPGSTRTDTPFPCTTLFRSDLGVASDAGLARAGGDPASDFIVIDVFLPAFVDAFGARRLDPGALPALDERQFHVRDHAPNGDHHPHHASGRRHLRLKPPPCGSPRSEAPTTELQSLMRISYAVFCLHNTTQTHQQLKPILTYTII